MQIFIIPKIVLFPFLKNLSINNIIDLQEKLLLYLFCI